MYPVLLHANLTDCNIRVGIEVPSVTVLSKEERPKGISMKAELLLLVLCYVCCMPVTIEVQIVDFLKNVQEKFLEGSHEVSRKFPTI